MPYGNGAARNDETCGTIAFRAKKMTTAQQTALRAALAKVPTNFLMDEIVKRGQFVKARLRCEDRYCAKCAQQAQHGRGCVSCDQIMRVYQRNKYRINKGIPIDKPTKKRKR